MKIPYDGKLAIFTTFYNYLAYSPYIRSLATTLGLLSRLEVKHEYLMQAASFHVEQAVNTMLTDMLESDFTDVLLIDSDESWNAADVVRLLLHPEEIVGASYRMKNRWDEYVGVIQYKDGHPDGKLLTDGTPLLKADRVAGGFMRIKVSALRKWAEAYPERVEDGATVVPFFSRVEFDGVMHCQDMAFCRKWQNIGGELWIDPNINIDHWGFEPHTGDLNGHLRAKHAPKVKLGEDALAAFKIVQEMAAELEGRN